jgi:putative oxidoreductase
MITAIRKVHAKNGVWVSNGGFEYNAVLLAAVFAITDVGPGSWSVDEARGSRLAGPAWALAELAAGAAGSAAAIAWGERFGAGDERSAGADDQSAQGAAEPHANGHVAAMPAGA